MRPAAGGLFSARHTTPTTQTRDKMHILPAIDLQNGQAVRLYQGDYNQQTVYSADPCAVARGFAAAGAGGLHVVDLDGARDGSLANFETVAALAAQSGLAVEVGGGIRTEERIQKYLKLGAARVILGTIAVQDFAFTQRMAQKYGERIAVGVDAKDGLVATHGWLRLSQLNGPEFCRQLAGAGVRTVIYTDIARDGAEQGANLAVYRQLCRIPGLRVIASGGVSGLEEIRELSAMGAWGAILGKALYTGRLSLAQAIKAAQ